MSSSHGIRIIGKAYDEEGAYERWLQNILNMLANQSVMFYAL